MTSQYISLEFRDLSDDKQEELKEGVKQAILEKSEEIGKQAMTHKWYVTPKTWQEAFCREADVDWEMWNGLEEGGEEFQAYDWNYSIDQYADKIAEEALWKAFHHLEIEVEL